jgi:hypothetical protein
MYAQALLEVIEKADGHLHPTGKRVGFNKLFTNEGIQIMSLLDIPPDCHQLVVCKDVFFPADVRKIIDNSEQLNEFAERMICGTAWPVDNEC